MRLLRVEREPVKAPGFRACQNGVKSSRKVVDKLKKKLGWTVSASVEKLKRFNFAETFHEAGPKKLTRLWGKF